MKPIASGITLPLATLLLAMLLAACGPTGTDPSPHAAAGTAAAASQAGPASWLASQIDAAMDHARLELATRNIEVGNVHVDGRTAAPATRPKAEITPHGELLIGGQAVAATAEQRALLLAYREEIVAIAKAGMDIGTQGADLGIQAARQALKGAFSGEDQAAVEARIKPQTEAIKTSALKLCQRLPGLLAAQQQLAAAMPAFQPYANMRQHDVDDCGKDLRGAHGTPGVATSRR